MEDIKPPNKITNNNSRSKNLSQNNNINLSDNNYYNSLENNLNNSNEKNYDNGNNEEEIIAQQLEKEQNSEKKGLDDTLKKKKKSSIKTFIKILLGLIATPFLIALITYLYLENTINNNVANSKNNQTLTFIIKEGETPTQISNNLKDKKVIGNSYFFLYYLKKSGLDNKIKAGNYKINPSKLTIPEITDIFCKNQDIIDEITITIPEGYTSKQIEDVLINSGLVNIQENDIVNIANYKGEKNEIRSTKQQNIYNNILKKYPYLNKQSDINYKGLEGYLFPDTYSFDKNATLEEIITTLIDTFDTKVYKEIQTKLGDNNLHDIIKLASIVQKESGKNLEIDKKIAGTFYNRIKIGMTLSSCATLQYITETNKTSYSISDTQIDSPYNTYQNIGLPIGPISNPGLISIKATLEPEENNYLFFLNTPNGEILFSETDTEHLQKQQQYVD